MSKCRLEQHLQTSQLRYTKAFYAKGCCETNCFASPHFSVDLQCGHPTPFSNKTLFYKVRIRTAICTRRCLHYRKLLASVVPIEKSVKNNCEWKCKVLRGLTGKNQDRTQKEALFGFRLRPPQPSVTSGRHTDILHAWLFCKSGGWHKLQASRGSWSLRMLPAAPERRGHASNRVEQGAEAPSCHAKLQSPSLKRRENTYPAKALHADVICVGAAGRPVDDAIPQLVIRCVSRHSAEQLAPILHQDWGWEGGKPEARYPNAITPMR